MSRRRVRGALRVGAPARYLLASAVCIAAALGPAAGAETQKKPNFAPDDLTGWQLLDDDFIRRRAAQARSFPIRLIRM